MTCTIFFSTAMSSDRPQISGHLPRKPQRWQMEWLVKAPDGRIHIDNSKTIQKASYPEVLQVMGATIDSIKAELGPLASFISWRLTAHGGSKAARRGGSKK